jgi:hypothetical protein
MRTHRSVAQEGRERHNSTKPVPAVIPHDRYRDPRAYRLLMASAVAIGVALRVREYAADRALWLDESLLSLNILDQSLKGLFGQLGFNQAAPPGFLLVERISVDAFGRSEYALRLFPLICGIASLFLFWHVVRKLLAPIPQVIAIALFSVSDGLIYYSAEVKQYSTDVAASLLILLAALALRSSPLPKWRAACWIAAGFAALALSYASAFVLLSVAIVLVIPHAVRKRAQHWRPLDLAVCVWLAGVAVAVAYVYPRVSEVVASNPTLPLGTQLVRTAAGAVASGAGYPAGGVTGGFRFLVAVVALAGFAALARRRREAAGLVALPPLLLMLASALHAYPVLVRTSLFLVPFLAMALGEGAVALASAARTRRGLLAILLGLAVCAVPATHAARHFVSPQGREEIKPVLRHLTDNWRPGDSLFVFYHAQYALRYYVECDCAGVSLRTLRIPWDAAATRRLGHAQYAPALASRPPTLVIEKPQTSFDNYAMELNPLLARRRVWLLVTNIGPLQRRLLAALSCAAPRTDAFVRDTGKASFSTAAVYRYDLTRLRNLGQLRTCATPTRP